MGPKLSRYLYFIIFHGAHIVCKVINTHHRRSPLVQGGLEIPVEVIVSMDSSDTNKQALRRCQNWVELKYKEPIDGQFRDATAEIIIIIRLWTMYNQNLKVNRPRAFWSVHIQFHSNIGLNYS